MANWGIRWGGLPERAIFGRGATVGLHYFHERLTAVEPISLELRDWELAVLKDKAKERLKDLGGALLDRLRGGDEEEE